MFRRHSLRSDWCEPCGESGTELLTVIAGCPLIVLPGFDRELAHTFQFGKRLFDQKAAERNRLAKIQFQPGGHHSAVRCPAGIGVAVDRFVGTIFRLILEDVRGSGLGVGSQRHRNGDIHCGEVSRAPSSSSATIVSMLWRSLSGTEIRRPAAVSPRRPCRHSIPDCAPP